MDLPTVHSFPVPVTLGDNPATPKAIRAVEIDCKPWFVAADACAILGHTNPTVAVRLLQADERAKSDLGRGGHPANLISESGLYKLVLRSDTRTTKTACAHRPFGERTADARGYRAYLAQAVEPAQASS